MTGSAARRRLAAALVAIALVEAAVAAKTKFTSAWLAPDAAGVSFKATKVAALVISRDEKLRVPAEERLAEELSARGMNGVATYRMVPREELESPERARGWYERAGVNGVVALRLVKAEQSRTYAPATWTTTNYSTLWGYYGYGWVGVYDPGGVREDTLLVVESLVYSVPRDKLLWAGVSETTNPKSAAKFMADLIDTALKEMKKQRLVD